MVKPPGPRWRASYPNATNPNTDWEGDGYSTVFEITNRSYANTPTFAGLSATNFNLITGVSPSDVQPYLTPVSGADTTPPE
jgi:hypothetical protein